MCIRDRILAVFFTGTFMTELGQHRIFPDFKRQRARMEMCIRDSEGNALGEGIGMPPHQRQQEDLAQDAVADDAEADKDESGGDGDRAVPVS